MNSVSNPAVHAAHHAKKQAKSALSGPPKGDGGEFGDLFANMQAAADGQNLAAPSGKASPPLEGLASQILGPAVHIITSETPAMSDDSLFAFARSQGMDESALALIFQRTAPGLSEDTPGPADGAGGESLLQGLQDAQAGDSGAQAPETALPQVSTDSDGMSVLDLGPDARVRWSVSLPGQSAAETGDDANQPRQLALEAKAAAEQAATIEAARKDKQDAPGRELAASLVLGEADSSLFAKRAQAKQASMRAERLGTITGDTFKSAVLNASIASEADTQHARTVSDSLDLGMTLTGEDLHLIWAHRQASAEQAAGNGSQASGQANAPQTDIDLRAEQYEKLSQRLGEALGQRLAAQIARGDWKVELALKPQDLGSIEIRLDMKQGALEASFDASEAMTRHLIIDGLQQLKDNLARSGMEVAQVNVNVRQDSQNGGNPTPGRQKSPAGISGVSKGSLAKTSLPADHVAPRTPAADNDGLDVLV